MDSDQVKLFVGGISWETNEDTLKDHFNKYGDVVESVIMRDKSTGDARGFGFVLLSDPSAAYKALQEKHVILGRTVDVKKAVPRGEQHQNHHHHHHHHQQQQNKGWSKNSSNGGSNNQSRTTKIFVGGLSASLTEEEFKSYFEKFGRTTDVVVMYDSVTHRPRGFGFITFDSEEAVENVMQKSFHELNNKVVEVKRAVPKERNNSSSNNHYNSGSNSNYNSYDMRMSDGSGSLFGSYQGGIYPPYNSRYGIFPGYAPYLSGYGTAGGYTYEPSAYGGGYPIAGFGGFGYGAAPIGAPRSPWNGPGMVDARRSPVPYGQAAIYPGYMNGGFMGMAAGGYHGIMGPAANEKWNKGVGGDSQVQANTTPPQRDVEELDVDSSGFGGSCGAAAGQQNQREPDEQFRFNPVGNSC